MSATEQPPQGPKIYLVHAGIISMEPIAETFRTDWPEARVAHLLEDSLSVDFNRAKVLTDSMIQRFRKLGDYCVAAGADAILFTCSMFGRAIDAVKEDQRIPVLKPNEAVYDEMMKQTGRIVLLSTFEPSLRSMMAEIEEYIIGASPALKLVDGMNWTLPPHEYLIDQICLRSEGIHRRRRHVVLNDGYVQWTSVIVFLIKSGS